jgi:pyruvate dehydrogenase E2 component (dihydrolipoamide acetyltransferase)
MAQAKSTDPNVFILPDLGEGVHEAEMISWKVKPGDTVKEHDILAEMETDKALVEVPSPRDGTIKTLHGNEGEILNVGNPLVTYEGADAGSGASDTPTAETKPAPADNGAANDEDAGTVVGAMTGEIARSTEGKALAAPAVRRLARDLGIDINACPGTGIAGRVTAKDVRAFAESGGASAKPATQDAPAAKTPAPASPPAQARRPLPPSAPQQPAYQPQPQYQQQPMPGQMPQNMPQCRKPCSRATACPTCCPCRWS